MFIGCVSIVTIAGWFIFIPHANTILADYGKADSILRNKNYSKNKITLAKPKLKYLVNFFLFGLQDFLPWHTITPLNPSIVRAQDLFSFATFFLDTYQNLVSTHAPQFRSRNVLFTLKLNLVMITLPNGSFTYCRLASRAGGKWKSLLCPQPFTFSSAQRESADSSRVFLPMRPSIRPKSKDHAGARNRSIFPTLGYKSPHRHRSLLIGQSFLCLPLLQTPKTLASSPLPRQMANKNYMRSKAADE